MHSATARPDAQGLIALAHQCVSGALQFDYLSSGTGHHQSPPSPRARTRLPGKLDGTAPGRDILRLYFAEIASRKPLSSTEEYCLACAARSGDAKARHRLIEHQLSLVVLMARRYRNPGLPLLDLIEEGNIGLMIAIEKFDPERGYRFSTYAKWWIRQSIELALMTQANLVRLPIHVSRELKRRARARARMDSPPPREDSLYPELLHDVRTGTEPHPGNQRDELQAIIDTVAAPEREQPEWHLQVLGRRRTLESAMRQLKPTEQLVLQSRFGLTDDVGHTLQDVARQLNLSAERVRQIQSEALRKLRHILQADYDPEGLL
jgi:RNA polymerase sigma factor (sigma-70 family)